MAAILADIQPGDEVIMPSFTFVSTANACVLRGGVPVFVDIRPDTLNLDETKIEAAITPRTRAVVPVHYAGVSCEMDAIMDIAHRHNLLVIEDAAQGILATYKGRALGAIGHMGTLSFHETKNIISGEGGMLAVNDPQFALRAEIIWEKGTNRSAFFRGEVNKYNWVDIGSSFLPSEITAAFLWAQLECLDQIQTKRKEIWNAYHNRLKKMESLGKFKLQDIPSYSTNNAHMFYLLCPSGDSRNQLIETFVKHEIYAIFHYLSLHISPYYSKEHDGRLLKNSDSFSETLIRLPMFNTLSLSEIERVVEIIKRGFN